MACEESTWPRFWSALSQLETNSAESFLMSKITWIIQHTLLEISPWPLLSFRWIFFNCPGSLNEWHQHFLELSL
jgi:hypothetical protein